jgi:tetratricopeptide (TPR) repeat protein
MKPGKARRSRAAPAPASHTVPVAAPAKPRPRLRYLLAGLALSLLTLVAYSNSFATGFPLDNQALLLDQRVHQASGENLHLILEHSYWWPNGEAGLYRPLTSLSYLFNYAILENSKDPAGYHWINWLLHTANVLLVFALAVRLLAGRARAFRTAFFIALLWAVHPVLTESVTNIVGRADLLAGAAVLGGFLMYLKSAESSGWRRTLWLIGLALAAAVGTLSKESAVVLPGVLILYELICRREGKAPRALPWKKLAWGSGATLLPIALALWKRALVLSAALPAEFPFTDNPIAGASFWIGRLTALEVLARYLWISVWPVKLSCDYSYSEIPLAHGSPGDWFAWLAVAAVAAAIGLLYRYNRLAFFFACFAFLNLLPASNLLFPIGTIMAERLLYLPLVGIVACVVITLDAAGGHARLPQWTPIVVVGLVTAAFAIRTWMRNIDWTDDLTMATVSVKTSPNSFKVHRLLASALSKSGQNDANIDRIVAEADKSVAILNTLPDELNMPAPWNLAASCHLAKGDSLPKADARPQYEAAVRTAQRSISIEAASRAAYDRRHGMQVAVSVGAADAYRMLASAYLRLDQADQALPAAIEASTINPNDAETYADMADAYLARERGEDAAISLAQGMFATGAGELREDLLKLYQSGVDTHGCAVVPGPRGPALNPACEIVHRDVCQAAKRAHRQDLFQQARCTD